MDGRVPVTLMLVHVDSLLRLVCLDEFFLSFLEPVIVLQVQGELQVHVGKLVAGMILSQFKGVVELLLIGLKINGSLNKSVLDEELSASFIAHALSNFDGDFAKLLLCAI